MKNKILIKQIREIRKSYFSKISKLISQKMIFYLSKKHTKERGKTPNPAPSYTDIKPVISRIYLSFCLLLFRL